MERRCYLYRLLRRRSCFLKPVIKFPKLIKLFTFLKFVEVVTKSAI